MKNWILAALLMLNVSAFAQQKTPVPLRFDGIYQSAGISDGNNTVYNYLRFFDNGLVMSARSSDTHKQIKKVLNPKGKDGSDGMYELEGNKIYFTITSETGTIVYDGKIEDKYYIVLKTKNLANGETEEIKYFFIKPSKR